MAFKAHSVISPPKLTIVRLYNMASDSSELRHGEVMAANENSTRLDWAEAESESESQYLHVLSAFLAMEPVDSVIAIARGCTGGSITDNVQRFLWEICVRSAADGNASYAKKLLKRLINEVELENGEVLDEVYEEYALHMSAPSKENILVKENIRITKFISFLFPEGSYEHPSCPKSGKLVIPMKCSLNMLEGDTGCSIWPSSLFLSEFVLQYPDLFANKSCFEVGSGVGLVGICLAHVKAKKVILTDGDLLTLANMKLNLERNRLNYDDELLKEPGEAQSTRVKCIHLPWETASESKLSKYRPDIILGADVIYDLSCLPHLLRVLVALLRREPKRENGSLETGERDTAQQGSSPVVAYIASVIRNANTFNAFLALVDQMDLSITDLTGQLKSPLELLPYMHSYDRSSIRLFSISSR